MKIREYLELRGFELETYYNDNKVYSRGVEAGTMFSDKINVRIFDEGNSIISVTYSNFHIMNHYYSEPVLLSTIDTFEQLDLFLNSILGFEEESLNEFK